jgi:hypothetical protein
MSTKKSPKKRALEIDPVSRSGRVILPNEEEEDFSSSSSSSDEENQIAVKEEEDDDERKQRLIRLQNMSPIRMDSEEEVVEEEQQSSSVDLEKLQSRIDEIEQRVQIRIVTEDLGMQNYLLQGLLNVVDLLLITLVWGREDEVAPESSDFHIERILLYKKYVHFYHEWERYLDIAIKNRVNLVWKMAKDQLKSTDHPIFTFLQAMQFGKIIAKRVFKRQMAISNDPLLSKNHRLQVVQDAMDGYRRLLFLLFRFANKKRYVRDIWTCRLHSAKELQMQSQPVTDANNRPVLVRNEKGTEKILLEEKDENGAPLKKLKSIIVHPQVADFDQYALINSEKDLDERELLLRAADELSGKVRPIGAGLPDPFQVCFSVQKGEPNVPLQMKGMHNFYHFMSHLEEDLCTAIGSHLKESPPDISFEEFRKSLYGDKNHAVTSIEKITKKGALATVVVNFRNILQTNLDMISCDVCKIMSVIHYSMCPTCKNTIRNCDRCKDKAAAQHNKEHQPKKAAPASTGKKKQKTKK